MFEEIKAYCNNENAQLIAVSKTRSCAEIELIYNKGHKDFGENRVQELVEKNAKLNPDIRWHMIGHLQTNKLKLILPFVHLIHSVDSIRLLDEIQKQAFKIDKNVSVLLQMKIAFEATKYGFKKEELTQVIKKVNGNEYPNVTVKGMMGMASFVEDEHQIRSEFKTLNTLFELVKSKLSQTDNFNILSMGMSQDYNIAIEEGSNMIRVGSLIFGKR